MAPSGPAGGPIPAGFQALSFTAISNAQSWLLGDTACLHKPCTSIVRTTDGGSSFVGLPAPTTALLGGVSDPSNQHGVSELRFADPTNGFASAPDLWATHDGGGHWRQVPMPGQVTELAASDGYVFAIVGGTLFRSPVGTDAWSPLGASDLNSESLTVHGPDVVTETDDSTSAPSRLLVSHDHGSHFASHTSPDAGLGCTFDEPVSGVIWALCVTGMQSALTRSSDGGFTFPPLVHDQAFVNSARLTAASSTTAIVAALASGAGALYLTTDGGLTFEATGPTLATGSGGWSFVGFTDAMHGAAIAITSQTSSGTSKTTVLYRTADGGRTWTPVPIRA